MKGKIKIENKPFKEIETYIELPLTELSNFRTGNFEAYQNSYIKLNSPNTGYRLDVIYMDETDEIVHVEIYPVDPTHISDFLNFYNDSIENYHISRSDFEERIQEVKEFLKEVDL